MRRGRTPEDRRLVGGPSNNDLIRLCCSPNKTLSKKDDLSQKSVRDGAGEIA